MIDCVSGKDISQYQGMSYRIAYTVTPRGLIKFGNTIVAKGTYISFINLDKEDNKIFKAVSSDIFPTENLYWDQFNGVYVYSKNHEKLPKTPMLNVSRAPYGSFLYSYSAEGSLNRFSVEIDTIDKQFDPKKTSLIPYTFGLEFETNNGTIPPDQCLRKGLIPLRDGSISGFEYATIVLNGQNGGFELLKKQIELLEQHTSSNKDCSLHIHLGNFPKKISYIFAVHRLCYLIQQELSSLLPLLAFYTDRFKSSGKNYCRKLKKFSDVKSFYNFFAERPYLGSLEQANPYDVSGDQKWRIPTRYYFLNVINALFYNKNKTLEFRCLMPSTCFNKIVGWIFTFSAILKYAEILCSDIDDCEEPKIPAKITLEEIFKAVYPSQICDKLHHFLLDLVSLWKEQEKHDDVCGELSEFDSLFFKTNILE
jgi:hypothetical protein